MRRYIHLLPLLLMLLILSSCGENQKLTPPIVEDNDLLFGTDSTFDLVTWNLKTFPLDSNTVSLLSDIIPEMQVEVLAFQEIMDYTQLQILAASIPYYETVIYNATSSYRLAYLYDSRTVTINAEYSIYNGESNPFPRPPYVLDLTFENKNYLVINNHFKAMGDGLIDEEDEWDEERRRRLASELLQEYISANHPDDRVIMLGDLNDQIQEPDSTNVFLTFLNKPDQYRFTTMPISLNPTPDTVSYPAYNSILDHILITDEIFADFAIAGSVCRVIRVEKHMGGLSAYYNLISDHRPVGIRIQSL